MNLILNGSFETGDFTNWNVTDVIGVDGFSWIQYNDFVLQTYMLQTGYGGPMGYLFQLVNGLNASVEYELSYQLRSGGGGAGRSVNFTVSINNGENIIPELTIDNTFPAFPWTRFSYRFTGKTFIYLRIGIQQDPDFFDLTNISLVDVTQPVLSDVITGKTIYSEVITTDGSLSICPYQDVENLDIGGSNLRRNITAAINIGNGTINNFPINIGNCVGTAAQTNIGNLNVTNNTSTTGLITNSIDTLPGVDGVLVINCSDVNISGSLTTTNGIQGNSLTQSAGAASHNFASCNTQYNGYDAQIITTGGTSALTNSGTLEIKAATINLTATNNLTMGSATSANTFIKNSISTIVGTNPTSYNNTAGTISGAAMNMYNSSTSSVFDMYSSGLTNASPSSRIKSNGGTSAINTGTLDIESGSINIVSTNVVTIVPTSGTTNILGPNNQLLEIGNGVNGLSFLDFHSYAPSVNDRDARIICSGGTNAQNDSGTMSYKAATHIFGGAVKFSGGYLFSKGSMTSVPMYQQTGKFDNTLNLTAGSTGTTTTILFTTAFRTGSLPQVFPIITSTASTPVGNLQKVIVSASNVSNSSFTLTYFNTSTTTTASGSCSVNWFAIGQW